jgi:hypothetical protein
MIASLTSHITQGGKGEKMTPNVTWGGGGGLKSAEKVSHIFVMAPNVPGLRFMLNCRFVVGDGSLQSSPSLATPKTTIRSLV